MVVLLILAVADRRGWLLYDADDRRRFDGRVVAVVEVVDALTVRLADGDGDGSAAVTASLWGLTHPHHRAPQRRAEGGLSMHHRNGAQVQAMEQDAVERVRQLLGKGDIRVELPPHRTRDAGGRLLVRLHLGDGRVLNEALLLEGLAVVDAATAHRHAERYRLLQAQARHDGRGWWSR